MVFTNEVAARQFIQALTHLGRATPKDLAVVVLHDDPLVTMGHHPTMSALVVDTDRLGQLAARKIIRLCRGQTVNSVGIPPRELIARESTSMIYRQEDPVRAAVSLIQARLDGAIDANLIAQELGISRFKLHRRCLKELGHSLHEEIQHQRLHRACQMLANTNATLKEIGFAIGIRIPSQFNRFFKQQTGLTPLQYRNRNQG